MQSGAGPDVAYKRNPGRVPDDCHIRDDDGEFVGYRRVHVRLFGGWDSRVSGHTPWPSAGGRQSTKWSIDKPPHAFDIAEYEVA